mmetsp:Transcript_48687/g.73535  ORF Transcript_48687/g.73535 Transcript_48687/m.73535 type:complete len:122 (-) Transcript_48687:2053-2418(-)
MTARMLSTSLYEVDFDPSAHFQAMEEVLRATEKMSLGQYVMCFPGRGISSSSARTSVSLHKAACGNDDDDDENVINVGNELVEAEAVYVGEQSLRLCFRPWVWDSEDGRIPFTFPMKMIDE